MKIIEGKYVYVAILLMWLFFFISLITKLLGFLNIIPIGITFFLLGIIFTIGFLEIKKFLEVKW